MGRVITPNFHHREKKVRTYTVSQAPAEPLFSDAEIWSRDYAQADGVVFGICALAAILSRHLGQDGGWHPLLLGLLDAARRHLEPRTGQLSQAARDLKDLLVSESRAGNAQDFSAALLITDLIEYTPRYQLTSGR
jgi:hypothetical protein